MHLLIPTSIVNSFDETATASIGINSLQTESKADKHSRESGGRTPG